MNDQEKSVLLAKAMGWTVKNSSYEDYAAYLLDEHGAIQASGERLIYDIPYIDQLCPNFYIPANMALAWRVHLWAIGNDNPTPIPDYVEWWEYEEYWLFEDAQRLWLDKILELAIEAGIVEVNDE